MINGVEPVEKNGAGEPGEAVETNYLSQQPQSEWTEPSWQDDEVVAQQAEVSTNTGSWNFKVEIEQPEEDKR